jgi:NDP-sugar pyrophosphorylase family protein
MIEDFFDNILVPEFLMGEFKKDDWYLVLTKLDKILDENIKKTEIKTSGKNLLTNGKVYIGENCTIGENVVIYGPVYIGDNVEIGPGAYIKSGSVICNSCSIGMASQVKNSIMMEGSKVANHVFLGDSIMGPRARIGGHSETANRRFDQGNIDFSYKDQNLFTGKDKLGCILGEDSRLGGGVFTAPGSMIGKGTFVLTMAQIAGYIPPHKFIKPVNSIKIEDNKFKGKLKHSFLFDKVY